MLRWMPRSSNPIAEVNVGSLRDLVLPSLDALLSLPGSSTDQISTALQELRHKIAQIVAVGNSIATDERWRGIGQSKGGGWDGFALCS